MRSSGASNERFLVYRRDLVRERPTSWRQFVNLTKTKYSGKVTLLDGIPEVIGSMLVMLGYSYNSDSPSELDKAKNYLALLLPRNFETTRGPRRPGIHGKLGSRPGIEALTAYGEQVGMVFQIVDDILDVVATDEELGKPAGNDLVEGVYTLPVIRALADPAVGAELRPLLGKPLAPVLPAKSQEEFATLNDTDFAHEIPGLSRFRVNAQKRRLDVWLVYRCASCDASRPVARR